MNIKPYRIDFKYTVEEVSSFYVCAKNEQEAKEGADSMLASGVAGVKYSDPVIIKVEEFQSSAESASPLPTLN